MGGIAGQLQEQAGFLLSLLQTSPVLTVTVLICFVWLWSFLGSSKGEDSEKAEQEAAGSHGGQDSSADLMRRLGAPEFPHMEGTFVPPRGVAFSNHTETTPWETDVCKGRFFSLCRATYCKETDKSGEYPHGKYFMDKKRLWEARVQFTVSEPFNAADMFFGLELDQYAHVSRANKRSMQLMIQTLRAAVGDQIYHSSGDDPTMVSGELELPQFVMPLMAFDQYIVTPEGETPPDLMSHDLDVGSRRHKRIKEYKREVEQLRFEAGPTYTFCFWGISRWLDKINWKVLMPLGTVDFNMFCGKPPVHIVMYCMKSGSGDSRDKRHLKSRKTYFFDQALWSSKVRPSWDKLSCLLARGEAERDEAKRGEDSSNEGPNSRRGLAAAKRSWTCCGGR